MNTLPREIVDKIISYTYNVQPKHLLEDIVSFIQLKSFTDEDYHNFWVGDWQVHEDRICLLYDISAFLNNCQAFKYGYVNNFFDVFKRSFSLQKSGYSDVFYSIKRFNMNGNTNWQINVLWGLMTPLERLTFCKRYLNFSYFL